MIRSGLSLLWFWFSVSSGTVGTGTGMGPCLFPAFSTLCRLSVNASSCCTCSVSDTAGFTFFPPFLLARAATRRFFHLSACSSTGCRFFFPFFSSTFSRGSSDFCAASLSGPPRATAFRESGDRDRTVPMTTTGPTSASRTAAAEEELSVPLSACLPGPTVKTLKIKIHQTKQKSVCRSITPSVLLRVCLSVLVVSISVSPSLSPYLSLSLFLTQHGGLNQRGRGSSRDSPWCLKFKGEDQNIISVSSTHQFICSLPQHT